MPNGSYGVDQDGVQMVSTSSATKIWALILGALQNIAGIGGGGSGGVAIASYPSVTQNPFDIAASGSQIIPVGAKGWTFGCKTGTGTFTCGTKSYTFALGWADADPNVVTTAITITVDSASTASGRYGT